MIFYAAASSLIAGVAAAYAVFVHVAESGTDQGVVNISLHGDLPYYAFKNLHLFS